VTPRGDSRERRAASFHRFIAKRASSSRIFECAPALSRTLDNPLKSVIGASIVALVHD
jgi:hypothetical protein